MQLGFVLFLISAFTFPICMQIAFDIVFDPCLPEDSESHMSSAKLMFPQVGLLRCLVPPYRAFMALEKRRALSPREALS